MSEFSFELKPTYLGPQVSSPDFVGHQDDLPYWDHLHIGGHLLYNSNVFFIFHFDVDSLVHHHLTSLATKTISLLRERVGSKDMECASRLSLLPQQRVNTNSEYFAMIFVCSIWVNLQRQRRPSLITGPPIWRPAICLLRKSISTLFLWTFFKEP